MNFGLFFANAGPFSAPDTFEALVRSAEEVGFESIWVVEHVVVPEGYQSIYPYSDSGKMPGPEGTPISDPLVALSYAAAITTRIKLATGIIILPQRHPFYVAKEFASLDVLSRGRAIMGIGIGWLEEEFDALDIPFHERAARTEESVQAVRSLWREGAEGFDGDFYRWKPVHSRPQPVQDRIPVVVGGHVEGAARRAARIGDGFFPARGSLDHLAGLFDRVRDECGKQGRDPSEVELSASLEKPDLDAVRRFEDLGVSRLVVAPPAFDPDGIKKGLDTFANDVIHAL
ncbi:MAG: LLM class F420-dependent oxidoreductase [Myxococcota bacterium]